jgi:hypothetical protein
MRTSLQHDIIKKLRLLNEQVPPLPAVGAEPTPKSSKREKEDEAVEAGQPIINSQDPVEAIYSYGYEVAKDTVDPQVITNAFKSAIQANVGNNVELARPVISRIRNLENQIMNDVANRLELFIGGTIGSSDTEETNERSLEEDNRGYVMKVTKEEIRQYVKEAVKMHKSVKKHTTVKEVSLNPKQLESIIRKSVNRIVKEGALFDTYRTQIDQEQSKIEQQLTSADIRRMAIDLFEKICDKTGVDADSLSPEAMEFVKAELDRMVTSAQEIANKLIQVATVVKTASAGTSKSEEGQS